MGFVPDWLSRTVELLMIVMAAVYVTPVLASCFLQIAFTAPSMVDLTAPVSRVICTTPVFTFFSFSPLLVRHRVSFFLCSYFQPFSPPPFLFPHFFPTFYTQFLRPLCAREYLAQLS